MGGMMVVQERCLQSAPHISGMLGAAQGAVSGALQASLVSVFPQEVPEGPVPGEWAVGRGTLCPCGLQAPTPCLRGHVQLHPGL